MELILVNISLLLSVIFGGLLVSILSKSDNEKIIKLMLAFSGGFLLSIGFIHFIPELYEDVEINVGVYILIGFLIQLLLEFFSGGIEHGHVHTHGLARVPIGMIVALCIHSFLEGIPLGSQFGGVEIATSHHHENDHTLLLGILFHRLPVAIALMTVLVASNIGKVKTWMYLSIFALMTPIGLTIGLTFGNSLYNIDFNAILAIVVGMFLHISTTIIFETSENHKFNFVKLITILGGCTLAFLIH